MQFLDRLKSMVGIGGPTIAIEGIARTARAGDVLRGAVVLVGGDHDVPLADLALRLDEQRLVHTTPTGADDPERQSLRQIVGVQFTLGGRMLRSGERLEWTFELGLPPDLEPSAGQLCYALIAQTEVPGLDPSVELPVIIVA